jgi:hypothetical protein
MQSFFKGFCGGMELEVSEAFAVYNPALVSSFIAQMYVLGRREERKRKEREEGEDRMIDLGILLYCPDLCWRCEMKRGKKRERKEGSREKTSGLYPGNEDEEER